jgi:methyl-accepting chemotaxis protein
VDIMAARTDSPGVAPRRGSFLDRWLADRPFSTKILLILVLLGAVATGIGALSITRMSALSADAESIYDHGLVPVQRIDQVMLDIAKARRAVLNHTVSSTAQTRTKYEDDIKKYDAELAADLATYRAGAVDPAAVDQITTWWAEYQKLRDEQMLPASRANRVAEVERVRDTVAAPITAKIEKLITELAAREAATARHQVAEARDEYAAGRTITLGVLVAGVVLSTLFGLYVSRGIVSRVRRVAYVADGIAEGDLTRSSEVDCRDEVGAMAARLDQATARLHRTVSRIGDNSHSLAGSAEELSTISAEISGNAEQASSRAEMVSGAAEQVSSNIATVAAASEEMTASIREIAGSATDAAGVARGAVDVAESANATVSKLGQSSTEIGKIVNVITSIAEQTNLLALNATIEAARAGEAGKGFAVVASEVKDLAQETAKATEEISSRITAIQTDTGAAVEAIRQIAEVIEKINGYSATIASAVEEQTATTTEIGRSVSEAASGATDIAGNITGVASAAQSTSEGVAQTRQAAEELARMSGELREVVGSFRL